jgi:hypothetical protein
MRSSVFAVVLCTLAAAAGAQGVTTQPSSIAPQAPVAAPAPAMHKARASTHAEQVPTSSELIKTAGAQPQDEVVPSPAVRSRRRAHDSDEEHEHRSGLAMLLAALALMTGIALRRYSARDE